MPLENWWQSKSYPHIGLMILPSLIADTFHSDFRQLRNLEKSFGGNVRVCDRTALILDIFNQRAATHEAALQVNK